MDKMDNTEEDETHNSKSKQDEREPLCSPTNICIMDAWTHNSMETSTIYKRLCKVVDIKRTTSDSCIKDLNKPSHVSIPYGKAPYRSRKAKKILLQNQSVRPVPRGTWIPGVNDEEIIKLTHYMPSETPPSTLRQHQRRVLSASSCSKSLCSSFNNRFMLPGSFSSSESSSEEPIRSKDDTDVNIGSTTDVNIGSTKYTGVRKTKSMHAGYCKLIQVNQCKETRFSTLPRKIQKVNSMNNKEAPDTVHKRLPVFDLEELDVSLGPVSPGLPGMCEITPRPFSRNPNNCTCCSICEMMSPRSVDFNNRNGHSNCSCEHCIYSSKDKPGLVQYKHGNVIKTFDWLKQYAKETAL